MFFPTQLCSAVVSFILLLVNVIVMQSFLQRGPSARNEFEALELRQVILGADGMERVLVPGGGGVSVRWTELPKYVQRVKNIRTEEMLQQCEVRSRDMLYFGLQKTIVYFEFSPN